MANPSADGGLPEFFDVIPNRASNSAIRANACPSDVFNRAFSPTNSSYEGGGTGGSDTP